MRFSEQRLVDVLVHLVLLILLLGATSVFLPRLFNADSDYALLVIPVAGAVAAGFAISLIRSVMLFLNDE